MFYKHLLSFLDTMYFFYSVHKEVTQFLRGLNVHGLIDAFNHSSIRTELMNLFIPDQAKLSFIGMRELYTINFSEEGSNARNKENDVIYCFEAFLSDCEGKCN